MRGANETRTKRARQLRRSQTVAESRLWYRIKNRQIGGYKLVRQEPIGPYIADFVCRERKLVIELDGSQHIDNARDQVRDAFLRSMGYKVLRFWNAEVFDNMDGVLDTILASLEAAPPPPTLSPQAGRGEEQRA